VWVAVLGIGAPGLRALVLNLGLVEEQHEAQTEHLDQMELRDLVAGGQVDAAYDDAFEHGNELFETTFNVLDGVGANVGDGQRFSRIPRADLTGPGQWASHTPSRSTGPNAQACTACHNLPFEDGAGGVEGNVHRDPLHTGVLSKMIQRNTPHLFGGGPIQRLAEEMTADLGGIVAATARAACSGGFGATATGNLVTKGVSFGSIVAKAGSSGTRCTNASLRFTIDSSRVVGLDTDLVVKPFQWKGTIRTLREFNRDASHNELGMQAVEIIGDGVDGDGDGVTDELTVGDETALSVYLAAQPRPTTTLELDALGLLATPLPDAQKATIRRGERTFATATCDSCHRSKLVLRDPIFAEPSRSRSYRDETFPAGQNPVARGLDPALAVTLDLTSDQPDNVILNSNGSVRFRLGALRVVARQAIVELYGDLKRHDLGSGLAEPIDEAGTGASVFLTENLWGVGSTAPYLHDGRATTLVEAIEEHGGEGANARAAFEALNASDRRDLIAFLDNLVLHKIDEE
jgi:hypothetical protein